jgi:hypothetical protein
MEHSNSRISLNRQKLKISLKECDIQIRHAQPLVLTPLLPTKDSSLRSRIHGSAHHLHPLEGIMDTTALYYNLLLAMLGIILAALANFCFQWGVSMKRWEKAAIQPQIPKDKGTPRLTRIRRITLLEADLNLCLSELFGRHLMANAEKHHLLHPHQYGSRKGKMCISAVLLKRISPTTTYDRHEWMRSCLTMMH